MSSEPIRVSSPDHPDAKRAVHGNVTARRPRSGPVTVTRVNPASSCAPCVPLMAMRGGCTSWTRPPSSCITGQPRGISSKEKGARSRSFPSWGA